MVIIQWSTRETVSGPRGHRHLCHRVLNFRTFYMFSSTSIFKTRSPETTVRSDISNPPRVWPRDYMQLELRQGHPPNGQSDWCHLWFPMLESAEPKKKAEHVQQRRAVRGLNYCLLPLICYSYTYIYIINIYRQYIYVDRECSTNTSCVCPGAMPLGLDQEKEYATFFLHVGNL